MEYIQIDNFNGNLNIISKDDGSGEPQIFTSLQKAKDTLEENCQSGIIVPLDTNTIAIIEHCEEFISGIIGEEGKENFDGIQVLCDELDEVLDLTN